MVEIKLDYVHDQGSWKWKCFATQLFDPLFLDNFLSGKSRQEIYLVLTPRGSVKSLTIKSLDIIELRDSVIVLTPPSLSLPLIKHLPASKPKSLSNVSLCFY